MRKATRRFTTTVSPILLGCTGSAPWEDACSCAPAWVAFASELGNPQPWSETMVEPKAVSTAVWRYLETQPKPATLEALQSMNDTFRSACRADGGVIRCAVWLWERPGEQRGLEIQVPLDETATRVAPEQVLTRVVVRDT